MTTPTPAGWYPDPYNAAQLRYWDGAVWTESVSPATGPPESDATQQLATDNTEALPTVFPQSTGNPYDPTPGASAGQWEVPTAPPALGDPGSGGWTGSGEVPPYAISGSGAVAPPQPGTGFGDIGEWLSSIFTKLIERIGPLAILLFVIPVISAVLVAVLVQRLLAGLTLDLDPASDLDFEIAGFSAGLFLAAVLLAVIGAIASLIGRLGANHQLYAAHGGQRQPLTASLRTALRRLPRAILWGLVLAIVLTVLAVLFVVILSVVLALSLGDDTNGDSNPLFALLVVPVLVLAFVVGAWLWAKLAFFFPALAVGPSGTNPFAASWSMSRGRFWSVFGRLLLVAVALSVLWGIFNAISQPFFGSAAADIFQLDVVTGDVFVDGQNVDDLDEIRWADVLPGAGWFGAFAAAYALGRAIVDSIWTSAVTGLYWRGGGRGEI